jgi:predicted phage tail protein
LAEEHQHGTNILMSIILKDVRGSSGCFPAGTKVNTPKGYRNIEDIKIGDSVYGFTVEANPLLPGDHKFPGKIAVTTVTSVNSHTFAEVGQTSPLLKLTYQLHAKHFHPEQKPCDGTLVVTGNHYILTESRMSQGADPGFALASDLKVGDTMYSEKGLAVTIIKIEDGGTYDTVYNFETGLHTYIAGGIRVHNGGGGKSSGGATIAPNTVQSNQTANVLLAISEGECGGLYNPTYPAQSVYFDNVPLQNADLTWNFADPSDPLYTYSQIFVDQRTGTPSQTVISGFETDNTSYSVGDNITASGGSIVRTVSSTLIDSVDIIIEFPDGLYTVNTSNGDQSGTSVTFSVYTAAHGGSFTLFGTYTVTEMSSAQFDWSTNISRPASAVSALWDYKIIRDTADSTTTSLVNYTTLAFVTENIDAQLTYDNIGLVGVVASATNTNGEIPTIAVDWNGILVSVPDNYNAVTRTYTGTWDGSFSETKVLCDNPIWCLYDLLTNTRYGLGGRIDPSTIDIYNLYTAAQYCDELVDDGTGMGTYEPRFTFAAQLTTQDDAQNWLATISAICNSKFYNHSGFTRIGMDMPRTPTKMLTNSNVVGGSFNYTSTQASTIYTACNVTFNDPNDNFLPKTVTEAYPSFYSRFGYTSTDLAALGCYSEGQARRMARYVLDTNLNNTLGLTCQVTTDNADFEPNETFYTFDRKFAQIVAEGRIEGLASGNTVVTLSDPITIASGTWTLMCYDSTGETITSHTITNSVGTYTTITVSTAVTCAVGTVYMISGVVVPMQWSLVSLVEEQPGIWTVGAVQYDSTKYARIETGVSLPAPVYQAIPQQAQISAPTAGNATLYTTTDSNGHITYYINLAWTAPSIGSASYYTVNWIKDGGPNVSAGAVGIPYARIAAPLDGTYNFSVVAYNSSGQNSPSLQFSYVMSTSAASGSTLAAPAAVTVLGGGTTFTTQDCPITWTTVSNSVTAILKDYQVVIETTGGTTLHTDYVPAGTTNYIYSYTQNVADGGPRRSFNVLITARDATNKFGATTTITVNNPAPNAVTLTASANFGSNNLSWSADTDPDLMGYSIWGSTTSGFTPGTGNWLGFATATMFTHGGLTAGQTWNYEVAPYDTFDPSPKTPSGLNLSGASSATVLTNASDNAYRFDGATWTPDSPSTNQIAWTAGTIYKTGGSAGASPGTTWSISAGNATWSSGVLFIYYTEGNATLQTTTSLATAIANNQVILGTYRGGTNFTMGNGNAYTDGSYILAGTVGAAQLVTGTAVITQSAQIGGGLIVNGHISASAGIDASKISATNLQAISALIGTLQTSSTGARMVIMDNNILVYDASGALRVKIGAL